MRLFFGMVLGCLLTIAAVHVDDSAATSTVVTGQAETTNKIVNWDVVTRKWGDLKETVHTTWLKLQAVNAPS